MKNFGKVYSENAPIILVVSSIFVNIAYYICTIIFNNTFATWLVLTIILSITAFIKGFIIKSLYIKSHTDTLTGLPNRAFFYRDLQYYIDRAINHRENFVFAMLDLDNFKQVNDIDGHNAGDTVIREVAKILKTNVREYDKVIRFGGDEFCIILPNTSIEDSKKVAERIRKIIYRKYCDSTSCHVTISIGLVNIHKHIATEGVESVIDTADKCLYKAKENRNKVVVFNN